MKILEGEANTVTRASQAPEPSRFCRGGADYQPGGEVEVRWM